MVMEKEDGFFDEGEKEELLDFEFDDLSEEDLEVASGVSVSEEEIIDLVDVVDEGQIVEALESDEIAMSLDEDELLEKELGTEEDLDLSESLDSDLEAALEDLGLAEEANSEVEFLESEIEGLASEELESDTALDLENLAEAPEGMLESEKAVVFPAAEESIEISEERIEAVITKVVQDVVEKFARETMTTVAERVIREAIDALKQSLEPPPV